MDNSCTVEFFSSLENRWQRHRHFLLFFNSFFHFFISSFLSFLFFLSIFSFFLPFSSFVYLFFLPFFFLPFSFLLFFLSSFFISFFCALLVSFLSYLSLSLPLFCRINRHDLHHQHPWPSLTTRTSGKDQDRLAVADRLINYSVRPRGQRSDCI